MFCETMQCEEFVGSKVLVCPSCADGGQGETEGITLADAAGAINIQEGVLVA
jgi:hypothetical protein